LTREPQSTGKQNRVSVSPLSAAASVNVNMAYIPQEIFAGQWLEKLCAATKIL
jgi:hypothetical protein